MKIKEVTKKTVHYIETDEGEYNFYTRYSANNWTLRMGESDEAFYDTEDIEKQFQSLNIKE